ncbi:hypothetical protein B4135_0837 [Caldibacillus debilis]|uniref:Uncharacterized protein n=1 Tax=Caldibacillus debilis TaxID=301148 RepID=A0A150M5Y4_9BACI|nr:hypothetical protein B4135_0837 [Caldibacillus debilis]
MIGAPAIALRPDVPLIGGWLRERVDAAGPALTHAGNHPAFRGK